MCVGGCQIIAIISRLFKKNSPKVTSTNKVHDKCLQFQNERMNRLNTVEKNPIEKGRLVMLRTSACIKKLILDPRTTDFL